LSLQLARPAHKTANKTLSAIEGFAYPIIHELALTYIKQKVGLP